MTTYNLLVLVATKSVIYELNLLDTGRPTPKQENLGHAKNGLARSQLLW